MKILRKNKDFQVLRSNFSKISRCARQWLFRTNILSHSSIPMRGLSPRVARADFFEGKIKDKWKPLKKTLQYRGIVNNNPPPKEKPPWSNSDLSEKLIKTTFPNSDFWARRRRKFLAILGPLKCDSLRGKRSKRGPKRLRNLIKTTLSNSDLSEKLIKTTLSNSGNFGRFGP